MSEEVTTSTPTTLGDARAALALADSSPADPTPETTPAESSAPAATTPAAETPQESAPVSTEEPPKGEPPKWRWQDILANARETTQKETEARLRQEYEQRLKAYEGIDEQTLQGYRVLRAAEQGNEQARALIAQSNPHLAHAMGWIGRSEQEPQPDAAIQMPDGSHVPVYTPEGMKKREAWLQKQLATTLESQFTEKFKPLMSTAEKLQALETEARLREQSTQWASSIISPLAELPYFEEFKPEILKAVSALPETAKDTDLQQAVYKTYATLHKAKLDVSTKQAASKALTDLTQRAVAATGNPATATTATPPKVLGDARAALQYADSQLNPR